MPSIVEDYDAIARRLKQIDEEENLQPIGLDDEREIEEEILLELIGYSGEDLFPCCI
jgi:hypothetical protein